MESQHRKDREPTAPPPGRYRPREGTPYLTQKFWRRAALGCVTAAGIMAWYGTVMMDPKQHWLWLAGYWGVFLFLLLAALYAVVLDLRFIRLQYALGARDLYRETVGDPAFREALRKALEEERRNPTAPPRPRGGSGGAP